MSAELRRPTRARRGAPSQILAFGAFVLGIPAALLVILGSLASSNALVGAGVIIAVPFVAVLMITLLQYFDRSDR